MSLPLQLFLAVVTTPPAFYLSRWITERRRVKRGPLFRPGNDFGPRTVPDAPTRINPAPHQIFVDANAVPIPTTADGIRLRAAQGLPPLSHTVDVAPGVYSHFRTIDGTTTPFAYPIHMSAAGQIVVTPVADVRSVADVATSDPCGITAASDPTIQWWLNQATPSRILDDPALQDIQMQDIQNMIDTGIMTPNEAREWIQLAKL